MQCEVMMIGFSADIGRRLGDTKDKEHCSSFTGSRWYAAAVYIVGFWFLDFANNTVQGPARAMMADLAGEHVFRWRFLSELDHTHAAQRRISDANVCLFIYCCSWTARPQRWPGHLLPVDGSRQRARILGRRQREMARVRSPVA